MERKAEDVRNIRVALENVKQSVWDLHEAWDKVGMMGANYTDQDEETDSAINTALCDGYPFGEDLLDMWISVVDWQESAGEKLARIEQKLLEGEQK